MHHHFYCVLKIGIFMFVCNEIHITPINHYIWWSWYKKQVSSAWISNYTPQYHVACNYLTKSWIPASGTEVLCPIWFCISWQMMQATLKKGYLYIWAVVQLDWCKTDTSITRHLYNRHLKNGYLNIPRAENGHLVNRTCVAICTIGHLYDGEFKERLLYYGTFHKFPGVQMSAFQLPIIQMSDCTTDQFHMCPLYNWAL